MDSSSSTCGRGWSDAHLIPKNRTFLDPIRGTRNRGQGQGKSFCEVNMFIEWGRVANV